VQAGDLLGGRREGDQRAVDLDPAVDERLPGLEDEQPLQVLAAGGEGVAGGQQHVPPGPRRQRGRLGTDGERRVERRRRVGDRAHRAGRDDRAVVGEPDVGGGGGHPAVADREAVGEGKNAHSLGLAALGRLRRALYR
jgi:hypothetical protein